VISEFGPLCGEERISVSRTLEDDTDTNYGRLNSVERPKGLSTILGVRCIRPARFVAMKRLKTRGASVMTPRLNESDLKDALGKLGVIAVFGDAEIHKLYLSLAKI